MNKKLYTFFKTFLLSFLVFAGHGAFGQTVLYNESVSGDLPNVSAGPLLTVSAAGTYQVKGTLATTADPQDRFQLVISSGYQITGISYSISGGGFINGQINVGGYASASGGGGSVSLSPWTSLPAGTYATLLSVDFSTGSTWSATFTVTAAPTPPSVSSQPSNAAACAGSNATFTSTATGSPTPTVQWQQSTDGGTTWTDIAGATNTTLTVAATAAKNGYQYGATFTNSGGTDYSNAATLTVTSAPGITTNPSNQTVTAGSSATFTAAASGSPTVQWQVSTDGGTTYSNISGATSNTLSFTTTSSQNGNKYRAVYTNTCGSATTTAAALTVNGTPIVSTNPSNGTFCSGATVTFTAAASGSPAPTVQWQVSTDGGTTYNNISGATSATLSFTASSSQNNDKYRAVFTNTSGSATTTAGTITVNTAASITSNPSTQTLCAGTPVSFTAAASGTPAPTIQWQQSTDGGATFNNISGATSATLSFTSLASQNGNQYRAVFTNTCGSATSTAATLNVNSAPVISTNPLTNSFCPGTSTTFTAAASGFPAPTVQWQLSTDGGTTYNNISGATSNTLTFTNTGTEDGYKYRAVYTNTCGSATTTAATLNMNAVPVVTTNPLTQTICSGTSVSFTAAASGTPAPTVQWQLSTDGGATFNNIAGATAATLTFTTATSQNGNQYRAVFTNLCNTATTTAATLNINIASSITTNPSDLTVCPGTSTSFTAAGAGTPAPAVQWQLSTDGGTTYNNITGATSNTLTFTNTGLENGYKYRAVYTNGCGSATTSAATLTLNVVPAVTTNPATQTICAGSTVTFTTAASGTPAPTVQWQLSTDGGATFNNIAGATATTLSFSTLVAQNSNQYRAIFTNLCNTATTTAATLNITTSPVVTTNPVSITSCAGTSASFTAAATATPIPAIQWQVSTDGGLTFSNIVGATSATLSFTSTAGQNGNQYRAVFTNSCGTAITTAAIMTVNVATSVATDPSNLTVCENATAGFVATANGIPAPTIQWQLSTDGGATFTDISGATSTNLLFTAIAAQSGNQYRAVFTNSCSTATTAAAALNVNTKPVITTNPNATTICAGSNASFTAAASGIPAPAVQWQVSTDGGATFNNVPGATSATFTSSTLISQSAYQYRAVFTNICGSAITTATTLTVDTLPTITTNPTAAATCAGTSTSLTVAAIGTGITYQWQVNSGSGFVNVPALAYYSGINSPTLFIASTPGSLNGYQYRCVVSGTCSPAATSAAATLTVYALPTITSYPINDTICAGNNGSFTIAGTGTGLSYQWQVDNGSGAVNVTNGGVYSGANTPTLSITGAPASMNMLAYRCVLSGTCAPSVASPLAVLYVHSLPAITANPSSVTLCEGAATSFSVSATGTGLSYQWQVNTGSGFVNVVPSYVYRGSNTATFTIAASNATMNNNQYRCVVSGVCTPSVTSAAASLTVNTLPAITTQPSSVTICEGNNATISIAALGTAITYQWQVDDGTGAVNISNGSLYSGVNTPTLTIINPPTSMNQLSYRCVVTGVCNPVIPSSLALLRVNSLPRLTQDLTSTTACEKTNPAFIVNATGTNISYQWQVDDGTGFVNVPSLPLYYVNTRVLTIVGVTKAMAGYKFRCVIAGTCTPSVYSSTGILTVDTLPVVTSNPVSSTICEGNSTSFSAAGTGTSLRYQWQVDMGAGFNNLGSSSQYSGVTTPTLSVSNTTASMNGFQYRCQIYGVCAPPATSSAATLTINTAPAITVQPANTIACNTASTHIGLTATGTGITYQWQINTGAGFTNLTDAPPYSGTATNMLAISKVDMSMLNYGYRCIVTGVCTPPATSAVATLSITNTTEWTGTVDNKWSNPANWSCGIIPIATTNVYIPAASNAPVVDIHGAICDSISIDNAASLTFKDAFSSLEIKGAFLNAGGFDPSAGNVIFSGDQQQNVPAATYSCLSLSSTPNKTITGNVTISDSLNMWSGILVIKNNNITIGANAMIRGASAASYIQTNGTGSVKEINVGPGPSKKGGMITVPVGVDNSYTPLSFSNMGDIDNYSISVKTQVYDNYGYTFVPYGSPITSNAVNKTWYLSEDVAGGSNVDISLQWNSADELTSFNRHACYVSPYVLPSWLPATTVVDADPGIGTGPYSASLSNVTNFPIFGVGSPFASATVYTPRGGTVIASPNPNSGSTIYASFDVAPSNNINIYITDLFGTTSFFVNVNPYNYPGAVIPLNITGLAAGEYILKVVDLGSNNEVRTTRFIKL